MKRHSTGVSKHVLFPETLPRTHTLWLDDRRAKGRVARNCVSLTPQAAGGGVWLSLITFSFSSTSTLKVSCFSVLIVMSIVLFYVVREDCLCGEERKKGGVVDVGGSAEDKKYEKHTSLSSFFCLFAVPSESPPIVPTLTFRDDRQRRSGDLRRLR